MKTYINSTSTSLKNFMRQNDDGTFVPSKEVTWDEYYEAYMNDLKSLGLNPEDDGVTITVCPSGRECDRTLILYDIKLKEWWYNHNECAHENIIDSIKAINYNKIIKILMGFKIEITAYGEESIFAEDYSPRGSYVIQEEGWSTHTFYRYISEGEDVTYDMIIEDILKDIGSGLWGVDLRIKSVQAILRYLGAEYNEDLVKKIINIREAAKHEII